MSVKDKVVFGILLLLIIGAGYFQFKVIVNLYKLILVKPNVIRLIGLH